MLKLLLFFTLVIYTTATAVAQDYKKEVLPFKPLKPTHVPTLGKPSPTSSLGQEDLSPTLKLGVTNADFKPVDFEYKIADNKSFIHKPYAKFIIPAAMFSYGITTRFYKPLRDLDYSTDHELGEHYPKTVWVDDYLQFAPAAMVYGLDFMGVPAKHNFRDRTLITATSYLVMGVTVETMKRNISVARPGNRGTSSFPSGHTATAFVGAHILMKEYYDVSPLIGVAGYTAATGVGVMRMINHKHWISDVVMGAGVGILSAEAGYLMLPVWHRLFSIKDKHESLVFMPSVLPDSQGHMGYGVGMSYNF